MSIVRRLLLSLLKAIGSKHVVRALPIWTPFLSSNQRQEIHGRLNEALRLLEQHSPAKFSRTQRSLAGFLVFGTWDVRASYDPSQRLCRLSETFALASATSATAIAVTIVHEATHGWLFDRGIDYAEPIRHRVEQICIRAALQSARRLPGAADEIERCRNQLLGGPEYYSNAQSLERSISRLREANCPEWLIRAFRRIRQRRAR
jgi:hypothetical protein